MYCPGENTLVINPKVWICKVKGKAGHSNSKDTNLGKNKAQIAKRGLTSLMIILSIFYIILVKASHKCFSQVDFGGIKVMRWQRDFSCKKGGLMRWGIL